MQDLLCLERRGRRGRLVGGGGGDRSTARYFVLFFVLCTMTSFEQMSSRSHHKIKAENGSIMEINGSGGAITNERRRRRRGNLSLTALFFSVHTPKPKVGFQ